MSKYVKNMGGDFGIFSETSAEIVNKSRVAGETANLGTNGNSIANLESGVSKAVVSVFAMSAPAASRGQ